jgi:hypothetical protein
LSGQDLAEASPTDKETIAVVEPFSDLSYLEQWQVLMGKVAGLRPLRAESLERIKAAGADPRLRHKWLGWIRPELDKLVGPASGSSDRLVASSFARSVVGDIFYADYDLAGQVIREYRNKRH